MKRILLLLSCIFISIGIFSQTYSESMIVCDNTFLVKSELQQDNSIKMVITNGIDENQKKEYNIKSNDLEFFAKFFKQNFLSTFSTGCLDVDNDKILSFGRNFFFKMIAANTDDTSRPVAGIMKIKDSLYIYYRYKYAIDGKEYLFEGKGDWQKFKIIKTDIEINNGFIMNMKAYIEYADKTVHYFILPYPTGISSVGNFKRFTKTKLIEQQSKVPDRNTKDLATMTNTISSAKSASTAKKLDSAFYIIMGDVIDYDYFLGLDRRDYSPEPLRMLIDGDHAEALHKEETKRLFEAHLFTDFIGLQEDKPNGLVQIELKKRININTTQRISKSWIYWLFRSYGFFHYIEPAVTFSKIEQHNRKLILGDLDSVRQSPTNNNQDFNTNLHRYSSCLDLYQYQWLSAGFNLNIFSLNNHDAKYDLAFNLGARLGITPVTDSITNINDNVISKTGFVNDYSVNSIQFFPEIAIRFLPEERFNFSLSNRLIYMKPLNTDIQVVESNKDNKLQLNPVSSTWLNSFEMLLSIQVNQNSKLFGRVRFNSELKNMKNNFSQIQVGYSTFILGNK